MKSWLPKAVESRSGFSVIELLVVISIVAIMAGMAIFYANAHRKLYQPDEEALQLSDMLQEGRQRALTERRTMRVEINLTKLTAKLYDENRDATVATDDVLLKTITLYPSSNVRVDTRPSQIGYNPPETMAVPNALYKPSVYPPSIGENVCTVRFRSDGMAVDAGTNAIGSGAVPTGLTLHVWSPNRNNTSQSDIARSLTILGATGVIRLWEFDPNSTATNKWRDSRRSSSYGG
jgi:prepilin-type N-terminal cleavage/methylation domain-containing protein